jgi:hypothetical protein
MHTESQEAKPVKDSQDIKRKALLAVRPSIFIRIIMRSLWAKNNQART